MAGSPSSCHGPTRPRPGRPRTLARPAWSESAPPASASGRNDEDGGFASILVWPDEVEGPVDDARSRYDVADLSGDPLILACAAGDGSGKPLPPSHWAPGPRSGLPREQTRHWHSVTCAVTAVHEMYALPALRLPVNVRHSSKPNISSGPSGSLESRTATRKRTTPSSARRTRSPACGHSWSPR